MSTHGYAYARVKKSNFNLKILEIVGHIDIILILKAHFAQLFRFEKNSSDLKIPKFPEFNLHIRDREKKSGSNEPKMSLSVFFPRFTPYSYDVTQN